MVKAPKHISWEILHRQHPRFYQYSYFILKEIKKEIIFFADQIMKRGKKYKILDMGCWNKPYAMFFSWYEEYIWSDLIEWSLVDVICDNDNLPFEDNYFDHLLCSQVLEHTKNVDGAIQEMKRVVKKDWLLFVSVPFLFPEHACPRDYWRFTRFGLQEKFKDFEMLSIRNNTWYFITIALFINLLFTKGETMRTIFTPFFLVINSIAFLLDFLLLKVVCQFLGLRKIRFIHWIIENTYKQFTSDYMMILKNSKK